MKLRATEAIGDILQQYHVDGDGSLVISRWQDVEPLLDQNKRDVNSGKNRRGHIREVANIPTIMIMHFRQKYGLNVFNQEHRARILKMIRTNPDYKYLRTV